MKFKICFELEYEYNNLSSKTEEEEIDELEEFIEDSFNSSRFGTKARIENMKIEGSD